MTHTPGPWRVCHVGHVNPFSTDFRVLAPDVSMEKWEANARLIAAAPDMLAALRLAYAEIHNPGAARSNGKDVDAIISAAIDKATKP